MASARSPSIRTATTGNSAHIQNFSLNDARFAQTVAVEPDTLYRITCVCRASGIGDAGAGATISIENTFSYSNAVRDTAASGRRSSCTAGRARIRRS